MASVKLTAKIADVIYLEHFWLNSKKFGNFTWSSNASNFIVIRNSYLSPTDTVQQKDKEISDPQP